jgi:glycosyltransferase involved in cell wall biosynthesis
MIPNISVCIPTYNPDFSLLGQAIDSAILQNNYLLEIVVIDNCSQSDVEKFINEKFPTVKYIRNEINIGMIANWNKCIREAKGEFIHILHDDDWVYPNFYPTLLKGFIDESVSACFCRTEIFTENSQNKLAQELYSEKEGILTNWELDGNTKYGHHMSATIYRKSHLYKINLFDESYNYIADGLLNSKLQTVGKIYYSPEILAVYRWRDGNMSSKLYTTTKAIKEIPRFIKEISSFTKSEYKDYIVRFHRKQKSEYFFYRNLEFNRGSKIIFIRTLYYCFRISTVDTFILCLKLLKSRFF